MGTYNTSDFRKGLKIQLDGDPYLMIECNFVKPGKGQALYKCRLKHLIRGTTIDRTLKSGDSLESADVDEIEAQYLYRQGEMFVFMDVENYEQYELSAEQVGDTWKYLKEAMVCGMVLYNGNAITVTPPNHVVLKIEYCEPGARGNTATNVSKPCKVETGAEFQCPVFVNIGDLIKIDTRTGEYIERAKEYARPMTDCPCDDFRPTASWENLRLRAELLRQLRDFFYQHGFLEVETPILSADTVVDRHLDPFSLVWSDAAGRPRGTLWLQTSPEFGMKRLLAAGGRSIYQVSRVFRQGERGTMHNPEFTLVEWYRVGDTFSAGMQWTGDLCEALLHRGPAQPMSYREAFLQYVGLDPHTAPIEAIMTAARQGESPPPASLLPEDRDGWLDWLVVERVQSHLGVERPTLLYDFPASQAALAQVRAEDPPVAERFELYVAGLELANGYHELLDAEELRRRNVRANAQRLVDGKPVLPETSRLLTAMEAGMPPAVGVALGFDRLVMLAAGAKSIAEVIAFPFDRA